MYISPAVGPFKKNRCRPGNLGGVEAGPDSSGDSEGGGGGGGELLIFVIVLVQGLLAPMAPKPLSLNPKALTS